jgi:hypothetical protein
MEPSSDFIWAVRSSTWAPVPAPVRLNAWARSSLMATSFLRASARLASAMVCSISARRSAASNWIRVSPALTFWPSSKPIWPMIPATLAVTVIDS